MRIISQNGKIDINYDNFYITVNEENNEYVLVGCDATTSGNYMSLGTFKTKEKALSVMHKIRNTYIQGSFICVIPKDE